jgi:hypothetical protein
MHWPDAILLRLRSHPFKTKLPVNFKTDWGHTTTPAKYPTREVKPIEVFDIKAYVKAKKQEQTMNSMSQPLGMGPGFNPFMGGIPPMGPNPMGPMGPSTISPSQIGQLESMPKNPFGPGGMPKNPFGPGGLSEIDIDQMMRDIDKKIAELDAEEARKKAELAKLEKQDKVEIAEDKKIEEDIKDDNFELPSIDNMIKKEEAKVSAPEVSVTSTPVIETPKVTPVSTPNVAPVQTPSVVQPSVTMDVPKPRVNVDADSIVVDENVISDDEFFDDFFGDDDE